MTQGSLGALIAIYIHALPPFAKPKTLERVILAITGDPGNIVLVAYSQAIAFSDHYWDYPGELSRRLPAMMLIGRPLKSQIKGHLDRSLRLSAELLRQIKHRREHCYN
jgi:hypothetical protein